MKRIIKLNSESVVIAYRYGKTLKEDERFSDDGELNQRLLEDGTFVDVQQPEVEPYPSLEDKVNFLYYREMGLI